MTYSKSGDLSRNMYFLSHISIHAFFLLLKLNIIYISHLGCPSRIISKVTKSAFFARVLEWRRIRTDCP